MCQLTALERNTASTKPSAAADDVSSMAAKDVMPSL
jgi:hypothetical protein